MKNNNQPVLLIIAGPNGSGKSTIIESLKQDPDFPKIYINADDIKKDEDISDEEAWNKAERQRSDALNSRDSFAFETVFSHPSKVDLMKKAKEAGYWVRLLYVCLQDADLNVRRVEKRHENGGHDVPEDRIRARYVRSIQLLSQALPIADEADVYNNSWDNPELIARKTSTGEIYVYPSADEEARSKWTRIEIEKLIGIYIARTPLPDEDDSLIPPL